jgi:uncharacterized protein YbjT (DUF2867 family)/uncharacterized membrane protein YphA (DoxX/SURF4 family)
MRIMLLGASGFIGRHLLGALIEQGYEVVCAGRTVPAAMHPRLSFRHADFSKHTSKAEWLARLTDIDAVINCVGIFHETAQQQFDILHVQGPHMLFAACAESQVQLVIQLSALGADADAATAYHLSKRTADEFLATLPIRAYIVQPSLVYGEDGRSARLFRALASMPLGVRLGDGAQQVQPIHVDDVVSAMMSLLRRPVLVPTSGTITLARTIALVGPDALPFADYLAALRAAMGLGRQWIVALPGWLARAAAQCAAVCGSTLFSIDALRMLERGNTADVSQTARLLGRPPRPVSQFISHPACARLQAKLDWLLPVLRLSLAVVWLTSALVSLGIYPWPQSIGLLERSGIPAEYAPAMLVGAAGLNLLIALGILLSQRRRWWWLLQIAVVAVYTAVIAWKLPEFLSHPYGPVVKNLPILAAVWLLLELEEE